MIYPKFLKKGGTIGVVSISDGKVDEFSLARLDNAYDTLRHLGYRICEMGNVRSSYQGRSANSQKRAKYLLELFEDADVDVIMAASGGDFAVEVLSNLSFDKISRHPKWFMGYSDNTVLGFVLTVKYDIASFYSDHISCFGMKEWHCCVENYWNILHGKLIEQKSFERYQSKYLEYETGLEGYCLDKEVQWKNFSGKEIVKIEGRLLVGCLDVLLSLVGTKYDAMSEFLSRYRDEGIVWFLETCELSSEQLIRGLWQLREAGWFRYVKGFVFGRTLYKKSYYGIAYEEALREALCMFQCPVIIDADFGHTDPKMVLINGSYVIVEQNGCKGTLNMVLK